MNNPWRLAPSAAAYQAALADAATATAVDFIYDYSRSAALLSRITLGLNADSPNG